MEEPKIVEIGQYHGVRVVTALTAEELERVWEFARGVTCEDIPDRHDDYLPLNLWDETPDE